jgi:hypothetical protein
VMALTTMDVVNTPPKMPIALLTCLLFICIFFVGWFSDYSMRWHFPTTSQSGNPVTGNGLLCGECSRKEKRMQFLRRNRYLLCFAAVLLFASIMVVRQFIANQTRHVQVREEFILLFVEGETEPCSRIYQRLIQQLPDVNEAVLTDDLQRTAMLLDSQAAAEQTLLWKYHVSVKNELLKRVSRRLDRTHIEAKSK